MTTTAGEPWQSYNRATKYSTQPTTTPTTTNYSARICFQICRIAVFAVDGRGLQLND